jgi:ribose/xylose/arabinose/galactoside ABC-type transport system permease subunit
MAIPTLPLVFIGWFFAIVSFAALAIGVLLLQQLFRSGIIAPEYLQTRIASDFALLLVWLIGLVSAFGLLNGFSWGRTGLEYFCWVLIALTLLSGGTRLAAYSRHPPEHSLTPRDWIVAVSGVTLVALPLVGICAIAINTLRSGTMQ